MHGYIQKIRATTKYKKDNVQVKKTFFSFKKKTVLFPILKDALLANCKIYLYIYIYIYIYIYTYLFIHLSYIYIRFSSPQDFHIIPVGFYYLPGEKLNARSHPGKFFKI